MMPARVTAIRSIGRIRKTCYDAMLLSLPYSDLYNEYIQRGFRQFKLASKL